MRYRSSIILGAGVTASLLAKIVQADPAIYSSLNGAPTTLFTFDGQPNPSSNPNESGGEGGGDDFNTGYRVVNLTGLTFYGGDTDPHQTNYGVQISFFTPTGVRVASITPSPSELYGIGLHTLSAADFSQNGDNFIQTTGAGYVVFQPYYYSIFNVNTGVGSPAPSGTPQFTLGFGTVPTLGANNPTVSALTTTPGPGVVSTGVFAINAGATAQYAQFTLNGTGILDSTTPLWSAPGSGTWDSSSSWTLGVPNSTTSTANFFEGITTDATVTLSADKTVGGVNFDNPVNHYTLAGSSTLNLSSNTGAASLNGWNGSHTIACPVAYSAGLNVTAFPDPGAGLYSLTLPLAINATGTLTKSGMGTLAFSPSMSGVATLNLPSLSISAGTVLMESSGNTARRTLLVTSALNLGGGRLDVSTNDAEVAGVGDMGLTSLFAAVRQGFSGGAWNGVTGITSSAAGANPAHLTAVGIILNSTTGASGGAALYGSGAPLGTFDGQSPSSSDVLLKYTYYGDANLDGKVDATDYSRIDTAFLANNTSAASVTGWFNGDFNYDGVINGSDYTLIDNSFNTQGAQLSSLIAAPTALVSLEIASLSSPAAVPEPSALLVVACVSMGLLGRHRRFAHFAE